MTMEKLTKEQAFVITCWTSFLFMDYEEFWKMAQEKLGETIINHEFAQREIWNKLKKATRKEFYAMLPVECKEEP